MESRVIDTLRYADRLKEAGIETRQAEAMSRAINAELTEGLVTKTDLDKLGTRMMAKFDELSNRLMKQGAHTDSLEQRMDRLAHRMDALEKRLAAVEVGLASLKVEVEALASRVTTQGRHVFLVLALIAGLGLYNAAAPHLLAASGASPPTAPPPATATAPKANS